MATANFCGHGQFLAHNGHGRFFFCATATADFSICLAYNGHGRFMATAHLWLRPVNGPAKQLFIFLSLIITPRTAATADCANISNSLVCLGCRRLRPNKTQVHVSRSLQSVHYVLGSAATADHGGYGRS